LRHIRDTVGDGQCRKGHTPVTSGNASESATAVPFPRTPSERTGPTSAARVVTPTLGVHPQALQGGGLAHRWHRRAETLFRPMRA
jgi:hypothetical protein